MHLSDWLTYIEALPRASMNANDSKLDHMRYIAEQLQLKPTAKTITVTGTNGKGSCAEMLTAVYTHAGYSVGTYTSPHLMHFNERIRLQHHPVDDKTLCDAFFDIKRTKKNLPLTYFEWVTLAALWIFKQANVQVMILEVGIGGRLDATNIVDADLAIITSIGLDHMAYLGDTREAIAIEKAGIFRSNQWAICGEPDPPKTLIHIAAQLGTRISYIHRDFDYPAHLPRPILSINNAAVVLQAIAVLQPLLPVNIKAAIDTIATTRLPGRCEVYTLDKCAFTCITDVAHNPHAAEHLAVFIKNHVVRHAPGKIISIFSMLADKDIFNTMSAMKDLIHVWHTAEIAYTRHASKAQLQAAFDAHHIAPIWHDSLQMAYDAVLPFLMPNDILLIWGSFFVVSEINTHAQK